MPVVQGVLQKVLAMSIEFFLEVVLVPHLLRDAFSSDSFQRRRCLDALNVEPPSRQVVVDRYVELLNASVCRVAKCNLRPERVLVAFAEESFQESSRLVNPDVRRPVQIYLAEVVLIADDALLRTGAKLVSTS